MHPSVNILLMLALLASLGACGKAGAPRPPPDNHFPQVYPSPALAPHTTSPASPAQPPAVDQRNRNFTTSGSYIDPSTRIVPNTQAAPGANLPYTAPVETGTPFERSLSAGGSALGTVQPSFPDGGDE